MRAAVQILVGALLVAVAMFVMGIVYVRSTGLSGLPEPGRLETRVARTIRGLAIPSALKARANSQAASEENLYAGMEHYARFCAMCHKNDGSGGKGTPIGNGLYPKPPDLRAEATQSLTDGELFYIIDNGVRFTGMPAFGIGKETPAGVKQVWQLVLFIRHLPRITEDEIGQMQSMNPL